MHRMYSMSKCDGDGDGVGGAVLRVFPCGTYATKTVSSPLVAKNWYIICPGCYLQQDCEHHLKLNFGEGEKGK